MNLSREARLVAGIIVLAVPTVMYGGVTLLGILTRGTAGVSLDQTLTETQWALYRAGHAHAGVWVILALVVQVLLDSATLPSALKWVARLAAPLAAVSVAGGFFGLAHTPSLRWLLYFGGMCLFVVVLLTGIGLLRHASSSPRSTSLQSLE
jgi:hypothetical protein